MQKSKLIGLLKMMSEEELERFRGFMKSPFFKKTPKAIALFDWIDAQEGHPVYQSPHLNMELIAQQLFPQQKNQKLRNNSLRVVGSELVGLIKDFFLHLKIEKEKRDYTYLLLQEFRGRRMEREFWQTYKKETLYQSKKDKTIEQYYSQYLIDLSCYYFQPTDKQLLKEWRKSRLDMHDVLENLDVFVFLNKLQYCCFNWNEANVWLKEKNIKLAHELIRTIEFRQLDKVLLVKFYYYVLLLLMYPNKEIYFFQLKTLLENNKTSINQKDLRSFYTVATNYCNQKMNAGEIHFYQEMFDLYELMIKQKLIYWGKFIDHKYIKNIVSLGLQLGKTDWVGEFIEKTKNEVAPQYRKSVYFFNKGILFFYTKEYYKALQQLLKVESIDVFYDLDYRGVLLKCYYELEETEVLFSLLDSFKKFVKQQKISDKQKKSYLHFIRCTQRLYKIKIHPNRTEASKKKIKQFILDIQPLNNQKWLLKKVEELL
ncbi:MAG: hypothetical protein ACPG49_10240 [Chitinophagales bacterium]